MAWTQISDLYNTSLVADNFLADQILTFIKGTIEQKTATNADFSFTIDLYSFALVDENSNPVTVGLTQLVRISDIIQFNLRNIGIRCSAPIPQFAYPYVTPTLTGMVLSIQWFIRDNREFMKQYY